MVYQSYNTESSVGLSEAGLTKMRLKEQKKKFKEAKKAAKDADKAAKYEADTLKKQRLKEARGILDRAGYNDVRVSNNMAPSAPECGAPTYNAKVASANRKLRNDELRAQARPIRQPVQARSYALAPARSMDVRPVGSMAKKPAYGYYSEGSRNVPVPITQQGTVRQDYLRAVNTGRPARAIQADRMQTASVVYPAKMTPRQAAPWIQNPGRGDVVGIDAPRSAKLNMYVSASRKSNAYLKYRPEPGMEDVGHVMMYDGKRNPYYVKVTPSGKVSKDYLEYINAQRPKSAVAMDSRRNAVAVIRQDPTPYQAAPWILNPGKYDISGIDTEGRKVIPATVSRPADAEKAAKRRAQTRKANAKAKAEAEKKASGEAPKAKPKNSSGKKVKKSAPKQKAEITALPAPKKRNDAALAKSTDGSGQTTFANSNRKSKPKTVSANRKPASKTKACGKKACSGNSKSCNKKAPCKGCSCNRK